MRRVLLCILVVVVGCFGLAACLTPNGSNITDPDVAAIEAAGGDCHNIAATSPDPNAVASANDCMTQLATLIPPATTTTVATTTTTVPAVHAPPAAGYFTLTAPRTAFLTDAQCAAQVHRNPWEPRPQNTTANHATPSQPVSLAANSDFTSTWNNTYLPRVDGNFSGTTDEIIQWAACKWGWSDNYVRGEAIDESNWIQSTTGDSDNNAADCTPLGLGTPCDTSFGFLQIKWYYNPSHTIAGNTWPLSKTSTAFAIDYTLAYLRGCYDGYSSYLGNTQGDVWGCIGAWYSGGWHDSDAQSYISRVQGFVNGQSWEGWSG